MLARIWLMLGFLLLGDRALLRAGGPGLLGRIFGMKIPKYIPHPYMLYAPNPSWRSSDGRARHNSLGFRGCEVAFEKAPDSVRIVCMGESSTYGSGIADDALTYPARLEVHLGNARPDLKFEVVNAAVEGFTSAENVLRALFDVAPLKPDLVVYYYTHNDAHARRYPKLSRDYREYSRSWFEPHGNGGIYGWILRALALARGDIGEIVRRSEVDGGIRPAINVNNNPPVAFEANISAMTAILRSAGARILFVNPVYRGLGADKPSGGIVRPDNPAFRAVWEHRQIVAELAALTGEACLDLFGRIPYSDDRSDYPNEKFYDFVHFTAQGADLAASEIARSILEILGAPPKSAGIG